MSDNDIYKDQIRHLISNAALNVCTLFSVKDFKKNGIFLVSYQCVGDNIHFLKIEILEDGAGRCFSAVLMLLRET